MKIKREVNGQVMEFELTSDELLAAFKEQEHLFDVQILREKFESEMDPDEFEDEHGFPMELLMDNQDLLEEMAVLSRRKQDKDGLDWVCARDDAIDEILEKHRDELEAAAEGKENLLGDIRVHEGLPEMCYSVLESTGALIVIHRGEQGYYPAAGSVEGSAMNRWIADMRNKDLGVTKAQESAMSVGSLFGWHVPAANPEMYDEKGALKKEHPAQPSLDGLIAEADNNRVVRENSLRSRENTGLLL